MSPELTIKDSEVCFSDSLVKNKGAIHADMTFMWFCGKEADGHLVTCMSLKAA